MWKNFFLMTTGQACNKENGSALLKSSVLQNRLYVYQITYSPKETIIMVNYLFIKPKIYGLLEMSQKMTY